VSGWVSSSVVYVALVCTDNVVMYKLRYFYFTLLERSTVQTDICRSVLLLFCCRAPAESDAATGGTVRGLFEVALGAASGPAWLRLALPRVGAIRHPHHPPSGQSLLQNSLPIKWQQPNVITQNVNSKITRNRVNLPFLGVFRGGK
jgi:hypothetical protein